MSHAKSLKERIKIREKATELAGEFIFELLHHDIFEFKSLEPLQKFEEWLKKHEDVEFIENNIEENLRLAVKYKDKK